MGPSYDLVVFSHLRWNFVWQRPQHLLTRMAAAKRVFFIEEPLAGEAAEPSWDIAEPQKNVIVCRPKTPIGMGGFCDAQMPVLRQLLGCLVRDKQVHEYAAWFYTPMALPLLGSLAPLAVVYDCMDELSAFLHAPPQLLEREAQLLAEADLVFTGGPSLYEAKKNRHPSVHCFPSSVDADHFGRARGDLAQPEGQRDLPHPRLGFFGVIDERLDVRLIAAMADARPDWQIALVGPVVKIDPATLPRPSNVHYFGQREYAELPAFLSGWDVCLLPFARNDATRYISPTKTLEYMAAKKPIVSTPIADVAKPYGDIVYLGDSPESFIAACHGALHATSEEREDRFAKMQSVLDRTSWNTTAQQMIGQIDQVVERRIRSLSANRVFQANTGLRTGQSRDATAAKPVVVIGAGPTGLSAAYHLGEDALLLEQCEQIGGWCKSIEVNDFTFDFAGHIMFSNDEYVHELYRLLLGENVHWQDREAWIYSKSTYTRYPFQGSLYGLPPQVIKECIVGAIEARFGDLKKLPTKVVCDSQRAHANGHGMNGNGSHTHKGNGHSAKNDRIEDCCGDGVLESTATLAPASANGNGHAPAAPANFEEFIYKIWGSGIAEHFAIPYNRKLWAVPLAEMETSWLGGRVPLPDLEEMIEGALSPAAKPMGPNARFGYPLRGGFQALMNGFLPHLRGELRLGARVAGFSPARRELTLDDGAVVPYEQLISTMPLPVLVRLAGDEAPLEVQEAARGLRYVSVCCVHIGVGREQLTEKHWIYYPEDTVFHRIFVQGNASPHCNPPGGFGLTCEITYHPQYKPLPCDGQALIERCINDCRRVGFFNEEDPIWATALVHLPHAYVIYDHARPKNVAVIREWLASQDVTLAGRYSEWEYYNSDHAFLAGKKAAERVRELRSARRAGAAMV
jgi:UDP-galactopyranose mutase